MNRGLAVIALVLAATACGGESEKSTSPVETVTATATETVTATITASQTSSPTPEETQEPEDPYEDYRGEDGFVTRDDFPSKEYGLAWPLTVDAGFLACPESFGEGAGSVTFTTLDGEEYALNGQASHDYPDIRPITRRGQIVLPLIDAALELC